MKRLTKVFAPESLFAVLDHLGTNDIPLSDKEGAAGDYMSGRLPVENIEDDERYFGAFPQVDGVLCLFVDGTSFIYLKSGFTEDDSKKISSLIASCRSGVERLSDRKYCSVLIQGDKVQ